MKISGILPPSPPSPPPQILSIPVYLANRNGVPRTLWLDIYFHCQVRRPSCTLTTQLKAHVCPTPSSHLILFGLVFGAFAFFLIPRPPLSDFLLYRTAPGGPPFPVASGLRQRARTVCPWRGGHLFGKALAPPGSRNILGEGRCPLRRRFTRERPDSAERCAPTQDAFSLTPRPVKSR